MNLHELHNTRKPILELVTLILQNHLITDIVFSGLDAEGNTPLTKLYKDPRVGIADEEVEYHTTYIPPTDGEPEVELVGDNIEGEGTIW